MAEPVRFRATLQATPTGRGGSYVELPDDAVAALGVRGRTSVVASIEGERYVGQVMPYTFPGSGRQVILGITKAIRAATGKEIGDQLDVTVERDDRSRSADVAVPPELAGALAQDSHAAAAFAALAPSHRREHAEHVAEAKLDETRRRRAAQVVERLRDGG